MSPAAGLPIDRTRAELDRQAAAIRDDDGAQGPATSGVMASVRYHDRAPSITLSISGPGAGSELGILASRLIMEAGVIVGDVELDRVSGPDYQGELDVHGEVKLNLEHPRRRSTVELLIVATAAIAGSAELTAAIGKGMLSVHVSRPT